MSGPVAATPRGAAAVRPDPGAAGADAGPAGNALPPPTIRPARLGDLRAVMALYRGQDAATRHLYHPFPFDRLRLGLVLAYMIGSRRWSGRLVRWRPRLAFSLLVVTVPDRAGPIAFGNISYSRMPNGEPRATFGYLVDPTLRGRGVGTVLHEAMIEAALAIGVRRGGGIVVSTNAANLHTLRKLGFTIRPSNQVDRNAPDVVNFETDGDLEAIARARRAFRAARASASAP